LHLRSAEPIALGATIRSGAPSVDSGQLKELRSGAAERKTFDRLAGGLRRLVRRRKVEGRCDGAGKPRRDASSRELVIELVS